MEAAAAPIEACSTDRGSSCLLLTGQVLEVMPATARVLEVMPQACYCLLLTGQVLEMMPATARVLEMMAATACY